MLETMNLRQIIFEKLYLMLIEILEGWLQYSVAALLQPHAILEGFIILWRANHTDETDTLSDKHTHKHFTTLNRTCETSGGGGLYKRPGRPSKRMPL